jgi:CBS domain-containing protein
MDKKIRDIMTPDPVGVYYDQTLAETARVMRNAGSGVVTDRDLVVRGLAEGAGPDSPVGPVCSAKLVGVDADADVAEAQRLMGENAVRRLPVIDDGQIVGIVSMGDLAASGTEDQSPLAEVSEAEPNT